MKVTYKSHEFSPIETYLMTKSPDVRTLKDCKDELIDIKGYMMYDDEKQDGSVVHLTSLLTTDEHAIAFQSPTATRNLMDLTEIMEFPIPVRVREGESKAGRKFLELILDVETFMSRQ